MALNYQLQRDNDPVLIFLLENSADTYKVSYINMVESEILEEKLMTKETAFNLMSKKVFEKGYKKSRIVGM